MGKAAQVQNKALLDLTKGREDTILWRNNVGLARDAKGNWIRFGLGGKGAADFIGYRQKVITVEDLGKEVAIFMAVEVKSEKGRLTSEQAGFLERVKNDGGVALIARGDGTSETKVKEA